MNLENVGFITQAGNLVFNRLYGVWFKSKSDNILFL